MIDNQESLAAFLPELKAAPWVALDTEADSLHAYPEKLCLLQISLPGRDAILDPLAGLDLSPLLPELRGRELILHGGDYDLRLLRRGLQFVPDGVFDTMWAARLLGHTAFGLSDLVFQHLGVVLEKGPQKMNWAQRPLSPRMEMYARNDTRFLQPVADIFRRQLLEKGRLDWLQECCDRMICEAAEERAADEDSVWRVKGSDRLDSAGLSVLRELWRWREQEAIQKNRPPFFVLSHELLVAISAAAAAGQPIDTLLPRHFSVHRKGRLLETLERALQLPPETHPQKRRLVGQRLTRKQQARFAELRLRRDRHGQELGIDPTLIASRATLVALAHDLAADGKELMSWQRDLMLT